MPKTIHQITLDLSQPRDVDPQQLVFALGSLLLKHPENQAIDSRRLQQYYDGMIALAFDGWDSFHIALGSREESTYFFEVVVTSSRIHYGRITADAPDLGSALQAVYQSVRQYELCDHVYTKEESRTISRVTCRRCGYEGEQGEIERTRRNLTSIFQTMAQTEVHLRSLEAMLTLIRRFIQNQTLPESQRIQVVEHVLKDKAFLQKHFDQPVQDAKTRITQILSTLPPEEVYEALMDAIAEAVPTFTLEENPDESQERSPAEQSLSGTVTTTIIKHPFSQRNPAGRGRRADVGDTEGSDTI